VNDDEVNEACDFVPFVVNDDDKVK